MLQNCVRFASIWISLMLATSLRAAESPLELFPSHTTVVVRIKSVNQTLKKVISYADAVTPGAGIQLKFGVFGIWHAFGNTTLEGVDLDGDLWVALWAQKNEKPRFAYCVAVSNLQAMKLALGSDSKFVELSDKYVVHTGDESFGETIESFAKGTSSYFSMFDTIDKQSLKLFNKGDINVIVNAPELLEAYEDTLEKFGIPGKSSKSKELPSRGFVPIGRGMNLEVDWRAKRFGSISGLQLIRDLKRIIVSASVTPTEIVLEKHFEFIKKSKTSRMLTACPQSDIAILNTLPQESQMLFGQYYGGNRTMLELGYSGKSGFTVKTTTEYAAPSPSPIAEAIKFKASKTGLLETVFVFESSNTKNDSSNNSKPQMTLSGLNPKYGLKSTLNVNEGAEKVGATQIDLITAKIESRQSPNPETDRALNSIDFWYGSREMIYRQVFMNKYRVLVYGGTLSDMEAVINVFSAPEPTPSRSIQTTRSKLYSNANFICLMDLPTSFQNILLRYADRAESISSLATAYKESASTLEIVPSYAGFSLNLGDGQFDCRTVIPVEQAQGIIKIDTALVAKQAETGSQTTMKTLIEYLVSSL